MRGSEFVLQAYWDRLSERISLCKEINRALALLDWDYETYMPPGSAEARAGTRSRLSRLFHETFTSDEVGRLLDLLEEEVKDLPYEDPRAGIVRATRRQYDRSIRLPSSLVAELSRAETLGYNAWERARGANDFNLFRPHLERIVALQIQKAEALATADKAYDTLLDLFEPEMTSDFVAALFDRLKSELIPFAQALFDHAARVDDSLLRQPYDVDTQWELTLTVIEAIGFDLNRGRQDRSIHPFTIGISPHDVRLTTRIDPNNLATGLFASIHEAGHGLYEQGLPVEHADTMLADASSQSIHESQSRLWENVVGRSKPFWRHFLPIAARLFPTQLGGADVERIYQAVNRVSPSPIRVEADEVTYNLHIFLRFELERDLIDGKLAVRDLPEAWNEKTRQYLGFTPKDDVEGVLQDVHWASGLFGYFPTYSLGTMLSVQLYDAALEAHPSIPEEMEQGDFSTLRQWLKDNVHVHGSLYTPGELIQKATGRDLDTKPFMAYIKAKYSEVYQLTSRAD